MSEPGTSHTPIPVVTVIIPTYNRPTYLREAIDSVIAQTFRDWELIIVDDGSTDETPTVIAEYLRRDARIRMIHQPNVGPGSSRNVGLRDARGEFIAFLDDDDLWLPEKLEVQLEKYRCKPELGLLYAQCRTERPGQPPKVWPSQPGMNTLQRLININFIPTLTVMVRKRCLDQVGEFDGRLRVSHDYDLWLRIAERFPFGCVPKVLARYRLHDANISSDSLVRYENHLILFEKVRIAPERGITRRLKATCISRAHLNLAKVYEQRRLWWKAVTSYMQALAIAPLVGLSIWDSAVEGHRWTAPRRLLAPYIRFMQMTFAALTRRQS